MRCRKQIMADLRAEMDLRVPERRSISPSANP
jgi:hypothetical protein